MQIHTWIALRKSHQLFFNFAKLIDDALHQIFKTTFYNVYLMKDPYIMHISVMERCFRLVFLIK